MAGVKKSGIFWAHDLVMMMASREVSVSDCADLNLVFLGVGWASAAVGKGDKAHTKKSRLGTVWSGTAGSKNKLDRFMEAKQLAIFPGPAGKIGVEMSENKDGACLLGLFD